jgi:ABC-type uncharacterized transport system permease subunit
MIRLEKRLNLPRGLNVAVPIGSILAALVVGAILLIATGHGPWSTYSSIVSSAFTSSGALSGTLTAATPLLWTGLAAAVAFRMGIFNIGGEGQFMIGAIAASGVGLWLGASMGKAAIPLMILAGMIAGAAAASISGLLRAYFSTNEIITTLMLNYVIANFGSYLIFNSQSFWRDLSGSGKVFPTGKYLDPRAFWPALDLGRVAVPFGFLVGIAAAALVWTLYRKTRFGFEAFVIGDSPPAAEYAGMRTRRKILSVMALSGAMAGIGGAADFGDTRHQFDPKGLGAGAYGYAGIVVAALARLNPLAIIPVAILIGGLSNAGRALEGPSFPAGLVGTLQGLILFCALGGEVLARYRVRWRRARRATRRAATDGPTAVPS